MWYSIPRRQYARTLYVFGTRHTSSTRFRVQIISAAKQLITSNNTCPCRTRTKRIRPAVWTFSARTARIIFPILSRTDYKSFCTTRATRLIWTRFKRRRWRLYCSPRYFRYFPVTRTWPPAYRFRIEFFREKRDETKRPPGVVLAVGPKESRRFFVVVVVVVVFRM